MPYKVALLNFEGPLDLLLQLIEASDLEVTDITLSDVTGQYLDYINKLPNLSPTELNQFLNLAARLIYLKSAALLPTQSTDDSAEDLLELAEQLEHYRHYQKASLYLEQLLRNDERSWVREVRANLPIEKLPPPTITISALEQAFGEALAALPQTPTTRTTISSVSLEDMTSQINQWVADQTQAGPLSHFIRRFQNRTELVVAFVALLELIRQQLVSVSQDRLFGDIMVAKA